MVESENRCFSGNLNRIGPKVVREPLTPVSLRDRDDGKSSGFLTSIEKGLRAFVFVGSWFCLFFISILYINFLKQN